MNALFNKGAHPRPSLFEESSVGQSGHGSESFVLFGCLVFSMVLIVFVLTSLVVLVSLVFPMVLMF